MWAYLRGLPALVGLSTIPFDALVSGTGLYAALWGGLPIAVAYGLGSMAGKTDMSLSPTKAEKSDAARERVRRGLVAAIYDQAANELESLRDEIELQKRLRGEQLLAPTRRGLI